MIQTKCGFDDVPGGASGRELLTFYGPTLLVDVGFDPDFMASSSGGPIPGTAATRALVDTGAGESCIDSLLAVQLNLPVVDRRSVSGVHGSQVVNMHLAQVRVPALNCTIYGAFAGVHLAAGGQDHQVLMGRTFLQNFTMSYDGTTSAVIISSS